jgi:hypothetical protein
MKPTWWLLYAIGLSLVGVLALVERFVPAGGLRSILQIAAVVVGFGLLAFWNRRNRVALELEECRRRRGTVWQGRIVPTARSAESIEVKGSRAGALPVPETAARARR